MAEQHRRRNRKFVEDHKANNPCTLCGESDPSQLEFHHREPAEKLYDVSELVCGGAGIGRLMAEVAKCDVLCTTCHRRITWI